MAPGSEVLGEPAAHLDGGAGHVTVSRRHQERGRLADFAGLRPPAEQRLTGDALAHRVGRRVAHLGHGFGRGIHDSVAVKRGRYCSR